VIARVVDLTAGPPHGEATHWTAAAMAKAVAMVVRASTRDAWSFASIAPRRSRADNVGSGPQQT
jgi:hypothetical protein